MTKIRILHIEDDPDDALLVARSLKKNGYDPEVRLVEDAAGLAAALAAGGWDIVLSDYVLPNFDGLTALAQVALHDPGLPFILISGAVGEETAVQIMKAGAKDFIMKDKLGRLGPAVARELVEAKVRKEKSAVEEQKRELEKQLWQAQKMEAIGTLAGGIAHDFNNILTAIIGYSELAEYDLDGLPNTQRKIQQVIKAGNRAKELVQHILAFSRQNLAHRRPVEVRTIVKDALRLLRATTPTTIEFKASIGKDCGRINANATKMHQVVLNLCTNASHAMAEGGVLSVSLDTVGLRAGELKGQDNAPGTFVRLVVRDTGRGISKAILSRVFEPYFTTKPQGVGTGLGLSLVLGIVKSHHGYITVDSEEGAGTTFAVYIPQSKDSGKDTAVAGEARALPSGGNEQILIVDDEEIIVQFSKEILESLGYQVETAADGIAALEIFRRHPDRFQLLITDMTMPKMEGTELARQVLNIRPDLPIILCTGHSDHVNQEIASEVGIREYCMKPLSGLELATLARKLLDNPPPSKVAAITNN